MSTQKVYLVEDCENAPGLIYAVFDDLDSAERFADSLEESVCIEERTVFYGQPPVRGFNK